MSLPHKIFLGMPTYDGSCQVHAARAFYLTATTYLPVIRGEVGRSFLTNCFNTLWAGALNARKDHGITHFAMLHADVIPQDGWLDVLYMELVRTGADMVSVVIPIKNVLGLTSTAIGHPCNPIREKDEEDHLEPVRRLTLEEVHRLPATFSAEDCGYPLSPLWVNTGCWLCDFTKPWCEEVCFRTRDELVRRSDGSLRPVSLSEDWDFSQQLWRNGCRVLATTRVQATHVGQMTFDNDHAWGSMKTDDVGQGPLPPLPILAAKQSA